MCLVVLLMWLLCQVVLLVNIVATGVDGVFDGVIVIADGVGGVSGVQLL